MFERFTKEAKATVIAAQAQARELHARAIGPEHILLGVLDAGRPELLRALASAGITPHMVRAQLADPREADAAALRAIGIDLEAVRDRVAHNFGADLFAAGQRRRWTWYRRGGHIPFTRSAKMSLESALRESRERGHRWIGPEHIALGVLRNGGAQGIMTRYCSSAEVRAAISDLFDQAA